MATKEYEPISWWSDYLAICLDIRISIRSYLATTCPSDRSLSLPLPSNEPQPEPQSRNSFGLWLNISIFSPSLSLSGSGSRSYRGSNRSQCPWTPQDARAHAECERYYQFDSICLSFLPAEQWKIMRLALNHLPSILSPISRTSPVTGMF